MCFSSLFGIGPSRHIFIYATIVITSIIVNFYNETAGKQDAAEMKEINKEENKAKKK